MFLKVVKSGQIREGTNFTLEYLDAKTKNIQKDIDIWDKSQRVFADCNLEQTKARKLSVVLVEGEYKPY